ncbi:MAG: ABC-2 transporter permease [Saprospiraceae bacterium]|nr:ABC-2 transporter permease [Saprospiraceae bacterium]
MFLTILHFELKYWLKNWSFYIYLSVFFVMALLSMAGAAGAFGEGTASTDHIANSPLSIYNFTKFFNKFLLFLLPAIVGSTIYKDFKSNFNNILFTYPFSKTNYLFAKFLSSFIIVSIITIFVELGLFLGTKYQLQILNSFHLTPYPI